MRYLLLFFISFLLLIGCKKDKFSDTPSLHYESVNTTELHSGQSISFNLSFTDAQGDLDSIFVEKVVPSCGDSGFEQAYNVSEFLALSANSEGEIAVTYSYNGDPPLLVSPQCSFNDTCTFRFILKDKGGHVSDTAVSETIVLIKNI